MGKIMVIGRAEKEYDPDLCDLSLEIRGCGKTSGEASAGAAGECERLLEELQKLGIAPESVRVGRDAILKNTSYQTGETSYESVRSLGILAASDIKCVNAVRRIIESGFENVSLETRFVLTGEQEIRAGLLREAVQDSRSRAELLAGSMGLEITGIDSANLSGPEDMYDPAEQKENGPCAYMSDTMGKRRLSDQLSPEKVRIRAEVNIVWLLG